jgi:H+-transporting ATPase
MLMCIICVQMITAVLSVAIPVDDTRGWVSFGLLIFELNLIVWVGYYSDRNAGNAVKELEVLFFPAHVLCVLVWSFAFLAL